MKNLLDNFIDEVVKRADEVVESSEAAFADEQLSIADFDEEIDEIINDEFATHELGVAIKQAVIDRLQNKSKTMREDAAEHEFAIARGK